MQNSSFNLNKKSFLLWLKFVPLVIFGAIAPVVVRFRSMYFLELGRLPWNPTKYVVSDVFSFHKSQLILVSAGLAVCFMVLLYVLKGVKKSKYIGGILGFAVLVFASAFFSAHSAVAWTGYPEKLQGAWIWLSYVVLLIYTFWAVDSPADERILLRIVMFSAVWIVGIGFFQTLGMDFFRTDLGARLMLGNEIYQKYSSSHLTFSFGEARAYSTLYNPNLVGSYVSMIIPFGLYGIYRETNKWLKYLWVGILIGALVMLVGSQSRAGIVAVAFMLIALLFWGFIASKRHRTRLVVATVLALVIVLGADFATGNILSSRMLSVFSPNVNDSYLTDISVDAQNIHLGFKDGRVVECYYEVENDSVNAELKNSEGQLYSVFMTPDSFYNVEGFDAVRFQFGKVENVGFISFLISDQRWDFADTDEGVKFITPMGKFDDIVTTKSRFDAYNSLGSNRVYIWTRALAQNTGNLFLGSGPDTFALEFPQNDYLNKHILYDKRGTVVDKAHNAYIAIYVEFGLLALTMFVLMQILLIIKGLKNKETAFMSIALLAIGIANVFNDINIHTMFLHIFIMGILIQHCYENSVE